MPVIDACSTYTASSSASLSRGLIEPGFVVNFLFCHYLQDSHFQYLPNLYASAQSAHRLDDMLSAVGFAALACQSSSDSLSKQAQTSYIHAVSKIQADLEDPAVRLQDETLAAVLLMALYETLMLRGSAKPEAWEMHAHGATALLVMRGSQQLETESGLHLFTHAATLIRFVGIQRRVTLPDRLAELIGEAKVCSKSALSFYPWQKQGSFGPGSDAMEQFADLFADMEHEKLFDAHHIINRAETVLQAINTHAGNLSVACVDYEPCVGYDEGYFSPQGPINNHLTPWSPALAQAWNNISMARLKLNGIIHETLSRPNVEKNQLPPHFHVPTCCAEQYRQATIQAAQDIYDVSTRFFPDHAAGGSSTAIRPTPEVAAGYFLVWPLFLIGCQEETAALFGEKSRAKLIQISETLCLPHARTAADCLAAGGLSEDWMHTVHVF